MANASTHNAIYLYLDGSRFDDNELQDIDFNTDRLTANSILSNSTVSSFMRSYGPSDYEFDDGKCITYGDNNGVYQTFYPTDTIWPTQETGVFWWVGIELVTPSTEITAILEFNSNGGSPSTFSSLTKTEESESSTGWLYTTIPNNYEPDREGYDFLGWKVTGYGDNYKQPGDGVDIQGSTTGYTSYAVAQWRRAVVTVSLSGTTTSDSIHVNAPTNVPNDSTFFVWQLYQGTTKVKDDSENSLGAHDFTGLTAGVTYTVKFGAYTAATNGEQTARGEQSFTTTSSNIWIYTSSGWKLATPYVYTSSGWKEAQAYIYTSSGWKQC